MFNSVNNYQGIDWALYIKSVRKDVTLMTEALCDFYTRHFRKKYPVSFYRVLLQPELATLHYKWYRRKSWSSGSAEGRSKLGNYRRIPITLKNGSQKQLMDEAICSEKYDCWDLGFFHRHPIYQNSLQNREVCILTLRNFKNRPNEILDRKLRESLRQHLQETGLRKFANFVSEQLASHFLEFFLPFIQMVEKAVFPKVILATAHGIYHPVSLYLLARARLSDVPIVAMQPGLPHSQMFYHDQVCYEAYLSTIYLKWGQPNGIVPDHKAREFGCFYREKANDSLKNDGVLVILPQIPCFPKANSSYWNGHDKDSFLARTRKTIERLSTIENVVFRCKSCDQDIYSNWTSRLISADINAGDRFGTFRRFVVLYNSTAIIEAFSRGQQTLIHFGPEQTLLTKQADTDYRKLVSDGILVDDLDLLCERIVRSEENCSSVAQTAFDFLEKYAHPISPSESAERLEHIVNRKF
jgi:hypothetical protein